MLTHPERANLTMQNKVPKGLTDVSNTSPAWVEGDETSKFLADADEKLAGATDAEEIKEESEEQRTKRIQAEAIAFLRNNHV